MDFSPKATFAKSSMAQPWTEVASSELFRQAAGAAMLQMQANLGMALPHETPRNCHQMEGARIFLSLLMNLTTPPSEVPARPKSENLNHNV